jgi:hypothetical protein
MTRAVSLVHPRETVKVSAGTLVPKCKLLVFCQPSIAGVNLSEAFCEGPFALTANGARLDCEVMQAVALSPAVREQLSADACARSFALSGTGVLESLRRVLSGDAVSDEQLLGRQLCNPVLELLYERTGADCLDLKLINLSALSLEALDAVPAGGSFSVNSEDELLERLLSLGEEYLRF